MPTQPYERYAEIYDRIGQRQFGQRLADAIMSDPAIAMFQGARIADLACGTGAAALRFAAAGFDVLGVDRSPQMLARAQQSAIDAGLSVEWLLQDLRDLALPHQVDFATCVYDSLNYVLRERELAQIFWRVAGTLRPGGKFIFDLNSKRRLSEGWADETFVAADEPDLFLVYRSTWDEESSCSPLHLTAFLRREDGQTWERFDEDHVERGYLIVEIEVLLREAGFSSIEVREFHVRTGDMSAAGSERSNRLVFVAGVEP
jgi:SAM-dependent methyltransferase